LEKRFLASLVLEVLAFNAAKERESIKRRQAEGIACAKARGQRFGRPTIIKPENWLDVTTEWRKGIITAREAMARLSLKPNTFYRLLKNN
jgi:DNA invertase Pin-like site-specific DNA recombinase